MSGTQRWCLVGLVALATAAGCNSNKKTSKLGPAERTEPVSIISETSINDDAFNAPTATAILSRSELDATKSNVLGNLNTDFNQQSLVVVSLGGEPTGGYWVRITGIQRRGSKLYVQGIANRPGKDQPVTQMVTYPAAVAVVPRLESVTEVNQEIESVEGQAAPVVAAAPAATPATAP